MLAMMASAHAQQTSDVGKVTVTGEGDKLGTGLIIDEDTAKAKSTVTKAELDKIRGSSNPYQALQYLPGVNATSFDATGLFGGNLRVRGFNSDQMGFTINGAPVNDSGSFSIFPQEYTDNENLCELFVTQGATDTDAPHVGASGGNIGLVSCGPEDKQRFRVSLAGGQLGYFRTFARVDTGKIGNFKAFISYSKAEVDKWKGNGKADRDHVDAGVFYDLGKGSSLSADLLYNHAVTNNFRSLTLGELASQGYYADFATKIPQHVTPVNGTKQTDPSVPFPAGASPAYYGYSLNPFRNYLITGKANLQLTEKLRLDVEPYFWYGYGTGGTQQTTLNESTSVTGPLKGGIPDINKDGDSLDTVMVYRGSVTDTHRPGITTKLSYDLEDQKILGGFWFERARHRQTAPATTVDNNGNIGDLWLENDAALLHYADGSLYQNRDVITVSTGESVFLQDTISLFNSKLQTTPGVSYRRLKREFTNYPSGAPAVSANPLNFSTAAFYQVNDSYSQTLPSLDTSYQFTPEVQGFVGFSKNFKAPGNFDYFSLGKGVTFSNGVGTAAGLEPDTVKEETSDNIDFGARYKNDYVKASVTGFYNKFKNRIATAFDPIANISHDYNVGDSTIKGVEVEAGSVPFYGFSAYASGAYTRSIIDNNMVAGVTPTETFYATAGKYFPDTPKGMAALSLQYATGPYLINLAGKFTSQRFLTLVNDQSISAYTTFDLNAAYQIPFPASTGLKNAVLRLNISNLANKRYLLANSGSGSTIAINAAGNPSVYGGAPRFTSLTFQVDY